MVVLPAAGLIACVAGRRRALVGHGAAALLLLAVWLGLPAGTAWAESGPSRTSAAAPGWVAPLPPPLRVTRAFDPPATRYGAGHRGVDLAGTPGEVVRAAGAGTVGYAGQLAGRGVVTVLHAGGLRTTYEPVAAAVHVGQHVTGAEPIGRLSAGHPGCSVAACLHWGLLRGADYLDPLALLGLVQVRLLPLDGRRPAASASVDRPGVHRGVAVHELAVAPGHCPQCLAPVHTVLPLQPVHRVDLP